jgi:hypothetical protein
MVTAFMKQRLVRIVFYIVFVTSCVLVHHTTQAQVGYTERGYMVVDPLARKQVRLSAFIAPMMEVGTMKGGISLFGAAGGAFLINNRFFIGGYGAGLINQKAYKLEVPELKDIQEQTRLSLNHFGLWLGYSGNTNRVIHPTLSLRAGWGQAKWRVNNMQDGFELKRDLDRIEGVKVMVIIPQVGLEVNVARWMRISAEVGYRIVSHDKLIGLKDGDLNGAFLLIGARFGGFY